MQKGSKEWMSKIMEVLGDLLLGIERYDHGEKDILPQCQLVFLVSSQPFDNRFEEVIEVSKFEGFRGVYVWVRGNNRKISGLVYDFYNTHNFPSWRVVAEVAKEFGLITHVYISKVGCYGYYHERLYEEE